MSPALIRGLLTLMGLLVIVQGFGLALAPRLLGFMLGSAATLPANRTWTRLQGLGMMLLGASFVVAGAAPAGDLGQMASVVTMSAVACVFFLLAILRRRSR